MRRTDAQRAFVTLENGFRVYMANPSDSPDYKKSLVVYWACVRALARLCDLTPKQQQLVKELNAKVQRPFGISDAIRSVLFLSENKMSATQVRDELVSLGFDMRKYTFPMGNVHNTLKRLVSRGEVTATVLRDESKLYEWNEGKVRRFFKPEQPAAAR